MSRFVLSHELPTLLYSSAQTVPQRALHHNGATGSFYHTIILTVRSAHCLSYLSSGTEKLRSGLTKTSLDLGIVVRKGIVRRKSQNSPCLKWIYVWFSSLTKRMGILFLKQVLDFWFQKGKNSFFPECDQLFGWNLAVAFSFILGISKGWWSHSKYEFSTTQFHRNRFDGIARGCWCLCL